MLEFGFDTFLPLFQTNFFPDLMQVYFTPEAVAFELIFVQAEPALTAPAAGVAWIKTRESASSAIAFFIWESYFVTSD
jgi:3-polyprenyl-4-hydroxybenzoate decarboxylase